MFNLAKKIFAIGSASAMVLASVPLVALAAPHAAGANFVLPGSGTVYFINSAGQKQPYTSAGAFLSYGFNSWSSVVQGNAEDAALPTGNFVPASDGSLIQQQGTPTVYLVTGGQRAGFTNYPAFTGLGYSTANVIVGDVSFMTSAALISSASVAHPAGTLVNQSGTVYYNTSAGKLGIPSMAVFNSWGFSFARVALANSYDAALTMSGVMAALVPGQLNPSQAPPVIIQPTGGLTVALDSSSPAAGSIAKSAKVTLTAFKFSAGASAVNVTKLVATRTGLSSDSDFSNIYLHAGSTGVQLSIGSFSSGKITFTGSSTSPLFTVPAGGMTVVQVRADIASGATTGDSIGVSIAAAADVTAGTGVIVSGSFPVNGNLMTIAAVSNLGALNITSAATLPTNINPGTIAANVGYFQFVGSNQPLSVTYLKFTNIGSVAQNDIQNIKLFNGSTQVGSAVQQNASKEVIFDLASSPLLVPSGVTLTIYLKGDIIGGASRTFQYTLQRQSDVVVRDNTYATEIVPTLASGTAPVPTGTANQVTVSSGSATVQRSSDSPTNFIAVGATNVTFGVFTFTATGEAIRISDLKVTTTPTNMGNGTTVGVATDSLKNGKLMDVTDATAVQIASTASLNFDTSTGGNAAKTTTYTIAGYWTIPAGTTRKLAVVADTSANTASNNQLTNGSNNTGTILVGISTAAAGSAQGVNSLASVDLTTVVSAQTLTFTGSALTVAKNIAIADGSASIPTAVAGASNVKVASFTLTAGVAEGVIVNTLGITAGATAGTYFSNLKLMQGSTQIGTTQGTVTNAAVYSFSPNVSLNIAAGGSIVIDVFADAKTGVTAGAVTNAFNMSSVTSSGVGSQSSITATGISATNGQSPYIATGGTLTVSLDAQTPTASQLQQMVMGATNQTLAVFNLASSAAEPIKVTRFVVTDTTTTGADLQNLKLLVNNVQAGPTVAALSATTNGTATFLMSDSNALTVPANSNISVYVKADINNFSAATSAGTHTFNLAIAAAVGTTATINATGATSGAAPTLSGLTSALNANQAIVYRTSLTIGVASDSPSGIGASGTQQTVGKLNVTNAVNAANQQATFLTTAAQAGSAQPVIGISFASTITPTASTGRIFRMYRSSDTSTAIVQATITPPATLTAATWTGTLYFGYGNFTAGAFTVVGCASPTTACALWVPTSSAAWNATTSFSIVSGVTLTSQTLSASAPNNTQQYLLKFDTTDAVATRTLTLSIDAQAAAHKVWNDGSSNIASLYGAPLSFGTVSY